MNEFCLVVCYEQFVKRRNWGWCKIKSWKFARNTKEAKKEIMQRASKRAFDRICPANPHPHLFQHKKTEKAVETVQSSIVRYSTKNLATELALVSKETHFQQRVGLYHS